MPDINSVVLKSDLSSAMSRIKRELDKLDNAVSSTAFQSVKIENGVVKFYATTDKTGNVIGSFDLPEEIFLDQAGTTLTPLATILLLSVVTQCRLKSRPRLVTFCRSRLTAYLSAPITLRLIKSLLPFLATLQYLVRAAHLLTAALTLLLSMARLIRLLRLSLATSPFLARTELSSIAAMALLLLRGFPLCSILFSALKAQRLRAARKFFLLTAGGLCSCPFVFERSDFYV